ncbi:MAG: hypothetical protein ACYDDF_12795 [Thermoplasmatota archaeon]
MAGLKSPWILTAVIVLVVPAVALGDTTSAALEPAGCAASPMQLATALGTDNVRSLFETLLVSLESAVKDNAQAKAQLADFQNMEARVSVGNNVGPNGLACPSDFTVTVRNGQISDVTPGVPSSYVLTMAFGQGAADGLANSVAPGSTFVQFFKDAYITLQPQNPGSADGVKVNGFEKAKDSMAANLPHAGTHVSIWGESGVLLAVSGGGVPAGAAYKLDLNGDPSNWWYVTSDAVLLSVDAVDSQTPLVAAVPPSVAAEAGIPQAFLAEAVATAGNGGAGSGAGSSGSQPGGAGASSGTASGSTFAASGVTASAVQHEVSQSVVLSGMHDCVATVAVDHGAFAEELAVVAAAFAAGNRGGVASGMPGVAEVMNTSALEDGACMATIASGLHNLSSNQSDVASAGAAIGFATAVVEDASGMHNDLQLLETSSNSPFAKAVAHEDAALQADESRGIVALVLALKEVQTWAPSDSVTSLLAALAAQEGSP